MLAQVLSEGLGRHEDAVTELRELIVLDPSYAWAHEYLAHILCEEAGRLA